MKDKAKTYLLDSHNEFEFEIGTKPVSNQLESCVTQLSVNQTAHFVAEFPPRDLSESKSPVGWRSAPALNPEMRRGLGVLLDRWNERGELKNTQGFRVVRAAGA
jgi:hypothetical protein